MNENYDLLVEALRFAKKITLKPTTNNKQLVKSQNSTVSLKTVFSENTKLTLHV
jgi:hypothetical protein